jgi:hypothetical protein
MYAQWRSIDDYQAMRLDPAPLPFLQEALTIAKFEPGVYEVVSNLHTRRRADVKRLRFYPLCARGLSRSRGRGLRQAAAAVAEGSVLS